MNEFQLSSSAFEGTSKRPSSVELQNRLPLPASTPKSNSLKTQQMTPKILPSVALHRRNILTNQHPDPRNSLPNILANQFPDPRMSVSNLEVLGLNNVPRQDPLLRYQSPREFINPRSIHPIAFSTLSSSYKKPVGKDAHLTVNQDINKLTKNRLPSHGRTGKKSVMKH